MALNRQSPDAPALPRIHLVAGSEQYPGPGMRLRMLDTKALPEGPAPVRMSRFELAEGARSPVDMHDEREVWIISQGAGALEYRGDAAIPVQAGDVLAFEKNASHSLLNTGSEALVVFSLWWMDGHEQAT